MRFSIEGFDSHQSCEIDVENTREQIKKPDTTEVGVGGAAGRTIQSATSFFWSRAVNITCICIGRLGIGIGSLPPTLREMYEI